MESKNMRDDCVLTEYRVYADLPAKLTLGLVSDLHECNPGEVLALLRQGKPDLILVAGDTFERHGVGKDTHREPDEGKLEKILRYVLMRLDDLFERVSGAPDQDSEYAYRFLREAGKIAPVFLSTGNHEWYLLPEDMAVMKECGVRLLDNMDCEVIVKGMMIRIGGLSSEPDQEWLDAYCEKRGYKILLCHHPEYYDRYLKGRKINLILSGHAHGGQIRIGNRGIYSPGQGLFPKYTKGVYDGKLVVSAGCSNTASVPRWGNPREVVMIDLIAETRERAAGLTCRGWCD